jgi:hypothetical protein
MSAPDPPQAVGPGPDASTAPPPAPKLDPTTLALGSMASALGAVLASAAGGGVVASLAVAAVAPLLTTFLTHPGPSRKRRVVCALPLLGLLRLGRHALDDGRRGLGIGTTAPLSTVATCGVAAFAISSAVLTGPELVIGHALGADRPLTLLPAADGEIAPVASAKPRAGGAPPPRPQARRHLAAYLLGLAGHARHDEGAARRGGCEERADRRQRWRGADRTAGRSALDRAHRSDRPS